MKQSLNLEPPCESCVGKVDLLPENKIIDYLMYWYGYTFIDDNSNISISSIKEALVLECVENKQLITKKLIVYLRAVLDAQHEEIKDGG